MSCSIGTYFSGKAITKFNELYYFEIAQVPGNAFQNCTALREVSLPKKMTALPGGTSTFKKNANMKVYFPEGYKQLIYSSFGDSCSNCTLVFPTTLTNIAGGSLYSGSNYTLIIKATTPPTLGATARIGNVYVPDDHVNEYKSAAVWSGIASNIHPLSDYDGSIVSPVW